jgi:hypothetical protein
MQIINYYQPWLRPFLGKKKTILPVGIKSYYYYSFEDGLWDLIANKFFEDAHLTFLIPNFYCMDVVENIKARGHKVVFYALDRDFQIAPKLFRTYVKKYSPDILIKFHACGITSKIGLPHTGLLIEDCVHRLVNPAEIKLTSDRHIIMDSLRKVSPLPGSRMFGTATALSFAQTRKSYGNVYVIKSLFYYFLFRLGLKIGYILNNPQIVKQVHEIILKKHDDVIGDSLKPHPGMKIFLGLIDRINFKNIERVKERQVRLYIKYLNKLFQGEYFYQVKISEDDYKNLHVYPLGFKVKPSRKMEKAIQQAGITVWFKFPESPWSQDKGVLFLPLGFHIHDPQISYIAKTLVDLV